MSTGSSSVQFADSRAQTTWSSPVQRRRGKGSHAMILLGDRRSFVPLTSQLPLGTRNAILRQLGLQRSDLQRGS